MTKKRMSSWPAAAIVIVSICIRVEPVMADETGFYVGANALSLLSTYRRPDLDSATTAVFGGAANGYSMGPSSVERNHIMWSADFGYMVSRNLGIEVSYLDLGSLQYSGFGTVTASDGTASEVHLNLDVRAHGPAVALVGALPMTNVWEINARVGAIEAKTKTNYRTAVGEDVQSGNLSQSSTSLLASVGTAFTVTTHLTLRLDYLRIQHIKEKGLERAFNVDGVTAGAALVF
ncbi:MAG TPA: outer membrane beta-barrel protein [Steroidobacteraceae bacterium]|nr:outer membrane beta-barrel protein [Steroidobacteraceae bacterium]